MKTDVGEDEEEEEEEELLTEQLASGISHLSKDLSLSLSLSLSLLSRSISISSLGPSMGLQTAVAQPTALFLHSWEEKQSLLSKHPGAKSSHLATTLKNRVVR
jgi:hypothetical protein